MKSDEALYEEVRCGSRAAFAELYRRYERPLFGFLCRRLDSRQDAEEVFQDAMLSLHRGAPASFANEGAFAAWLYKTALHLTLNRQRSQQRRQKALTRLAEAGEPLAQDDTLAYEQKLGEVQRAADSLSAPLQEVYLHRREGKSYEEMATLLGVPVGTIKSRVHLMVARLRKEIAKWTAY